MLYAQLNEQNICTGISDLNGEVPEYNYANVDNYNPITEETTTEQVFVSRMIEIPVYSLNYIGLQYDGEWKELIE